MGRFLTSQHILNAENLTKAQFKKIFSDAVKKKGYVTCNENSAEISYTLVFPKDRKWVSVLNPDYQPGAENVLKDAGFFAEALKTNVISVGLVDSDFAELKLFDSSGKLADTLILGESYMDEPSPTVKEDFWKPLLTENSTWEQVTEIQNGSYTFAEEALAEFAPLIGMESEQILLDCDDVDDNATMMHFKKAGEKKLTLNTAFKQVFGKALEPLGFVKSKTKYPYYIRLVDNSFIQIIGLKKENENVFDITAGIATIYRSEIDLNCNPRMNCNWMIGVSEFYQSSHVYDYDRKYRCSIMNFGFPKYESGSVIDAFERALNEVKKWVLPEFEKVQTLSDVIDYLYTFYFPGLDIFGPDVQFYRHVNDRDGLFCFELDDPYEIADRRAENAIKRALYKVEHNIENFTETDYVKLCEDIKQSTKERKEYIGNILNNKQLYDETMAEIRRRKEGNIEILGSYGVDI